ncbi:hypothetical protein Zmor_014754 [Zophobas morio]|uniref:Tyr recombinase domain-containing protein n=1 Tax=Zophobas morio TaxID=2755281 RepID=A0AA38ID30_9CUCU|nr:hypothetical protein Zmor_014754 [Zophobas morio]
MLAKKGKTIKTDRLCLTENPSWKTSSWYKNSPVGVNEFSKRFKTSAEKVGLDTKSRKITNHSARSTALSQLTKAGIGEQQLTKITGHSSAGSIRPYLQLDSSHHNKIVTTFRQDITAVESGEKRR